MSNMVEKLSDVQSEAGVVATLVHHPEFILHTDYLKPGYFYLKENGCIYWAIDQLYRKGIDNIDAFNITSMLRSNEAVSRKIASVNMPPMEQYIELSRNAARHTLEEYLVLAANIVTLSYKRELFKGLRSLSGDVVSPGLTIDQANKVVYDQLEQLTNKYLFDNETIMFGDMVDSLYDDVCKRRVGNGLYGIPSKFEKLCNYIVYEFGELTMVCGKKKEGKSAFMLNEATHKLLMNVPTVYFDTEMNDRSFYVRMLSNITGIEQRKIKSGNLVKEEIDIINKANDWMRQQKFVHKFLPAITMEEVYQTCKILKYKMGLQFVIFDYFKSNEMGSSEQYNDLGKKCDFLKNKVAGELDLAVLAGAQLNRGGEIADSDKLERYASSTMIWRRKTADELRNDGKSCGNYALNVRLNRNGEQMYDDEYLDFNFMGSIMRIEEAEQHSTEKPI